MINSEYTWQLYSKELKTFVFSKLKDRDKTNDLLQEVFIKLHLNLDSIHPAKTRQWLFAVARNLVNDYFRSVKLQNKILVYDNEENENEIGLNERFAKCMASFINKLPAKYKEAITLVELNKVDQKYLAEKLNISYSGAKSRVQRGRELLKSLFLQCCQVTSDKYGNIVEHTAKSNCTNCAV